MTEGINSKRRVLREKFVMDHMDLCQEVFTGVNSREEYKSPEGRSLVELARHELNYSPKTVPTDIYHRLFESYEYLIKCQK